MISSLNRDFKKAFSEMFFLKFFCIFYFVLYALFIFYFKLAYAWSMAFAFGIIVLLMCIYLFYRKHKLNTSFEQLWVSETDLKIEKTIKVLEEHGFYSNNEKLFLLMEQYKDKIRGSESHHDIFSLIISVVLTFLPILITSETIDSYFVTQIISCVGILLIIYLGYLFFKKLWNTTITDVFNGQTFVKGIYEILFYIYCRKLNELSSDKKNLKRVAYELKKSH